MGRRDKRAVGDTGVSGSKLSDAPYFTRDSSCGNDVYRRDTGKKSSRSKGKSTLYLLSEEEDSVLKVPKLIE